jgi:DNA end-binding protein Ku
VSISTTSRTSKSPKTCWIAKHIVDQNSGHFDPEKFEDHYEKTLNELLTKKQKGLSITAAKRPQASNVVGQMDALRQSLKSEPASRTKKAPAKKASKKRKAG